MAVESAAKDSSVSPEVLFDVAKKWYELYEDSRRKQAINEQQARSSPAPPAASSSPPQLASSSPQHSNNDLAALAVLEVRHRDIASYHKVLLMYAHS